MKNVIVYLYDLYIDHLKTLHSGTESYTFGHKAENIIPILRYILSFKAESNSDFSFSFSSVLI